MFVKEIPVHYILHLHKYEDYKDRLIKKWQRTVKKKSFEKCLCSDNYLAFLNILHYVFVIIKLMINSGMPRIQAQ